MKKISSKQDLAIFGAPPAFSEPLHVGRPNIGDKVRFQEFVDGIFERRLLTNNGPLVGQFEASVADYLGARHCIAMCNGTVALEIAIRALGLSGEVIIPSYTFIATAHALHWQEITPVFADIDPLTHSLDPAAVRRMITPRTTGIIGVHLWGRGAAHAELQAIADEHELKLMYDAAHAFGCSLGGAMIGNFGSCEVFSFHATKFFNSFEGGAVVTNSNALADKIRLMRNFGFAGFDNVVYPGTNGKMVEVCAAMGLTNLEYIDTVIAANRRNYNAYRRGIGSISDLSVFSYDDFERNNYQYVVMEVGERFPASRDEIVAALHAENILARKYFWPGCHGMELYRKFFPHANLMLANTEKVANRVIVLPTGTSVNADDIELIVDLLRCLSGDNR